MATNVKCNSDSYKQTTKRAKLLKISSSSALPLLSRTLCAPAVSTDLSSIYTPIWAPALSLKMQTQLDPRIACLAVEVGREEPTNPESLFIKNGRTNRNKKELIIFKTI